jgi:hypothetical protein
VVRRSAQGARKRRDGRCALKSAPDAMESVRPMTPEWSMMPSWRTCGRGNGTCQRLSFTREGLDTHEDANDLALASDRRRRVGVPVPVAVAKYAVLVAVGFRRMV